MANECNHGRVLSKDCPPDDTPKPRVGEPFTVCVGNYTLVYDGYILKKEARSYQVPDGAYTQLTFSDGCIVGAGQAPIAAYTPSDCCSPPGRDTGGTVAPTADISPVACNWLSVSPQGYFVTPHIFGDAGIQVSGCGTSSDPMVIKLAGGGGGSSGSVAAQSPNGTITVHGSGAPSDPLTVDLAPIGVSGVYGGFSVDSYGRITNYSAGGSTVNAVYGGRGVTVTTTSGVATVELTGSAMAAGGSFYTPPDPVLGGTGKRIYFNADGLITNVVDVA